MKGRGHHEPWGDEHRTRQLARVLTLLGLVVVVGAVIGIVVVLLG